jgi:hypothetical protein
MSIDDHTSESPAPTVPPQREMDRRSWYMPKAVADALAEEIDELHFTTRRPKWTVLMAIIAVAMDHRDEIRAKLGAREDADQSGGRGPRR